MSVYAVVCPSLRKNQKRKHTSIYVYMLKKKKILLKLN